MDATTLSANFEAREKATAELRKLTEDFAGKDMSAEARQTEENLLTAIADYDGRIKRGIEAQRANENVTSLMSQFAAGSGAQKRDGVPTDNDRLRSIADMGIGDGVNFEKRAVDTTTAANAVDRTLFGQLLAEAVERSAVMRGGATVFNTSGGEPMDFTVVTGRASAAIVAENGLIGDSEPTTVQRSMGAYKYAYATTLSSEFVQDKALDLVGFLVGDAGPAIGDGMGRHFLTGTGTGQPAGILTAGSPSTATWAASTATDEQIADGLIDLFYELPSSYRGAAKYVVSDKTAAIMRKLRDANGQFLWASGAVAGAPDTFNGKTVLTDDGQPDDKVLFADLSKYRIRFAGPLRVERSVDYKFMNDQIVYRFIQRADGLLVDTRSAKVLTIGA